MSYFSPPAHQPIDTDIEDALDALARMCADGRYEWDRNTCVHNIMQDEIDHYISNNHSDCEDRKAARR